MSLSPAVPRSLPLLPITVVVFIGFLTMGLALPVLPLHVHDTLGMGPTIVGVVAGSQFAAALVSRLWAGMLADTKGTKLSTQVGLLAAALSGVLYHLSLFFLDIPAASVGILIGGRLLIGCAESFVITGALSWGVSLVGAQNAGMVMAWVGVAMFGAYAAAAPVGVYLFAHYGFSGLSTATVLIPLLAMACLLPLASVPPSGARRPAFYKVIGAVLLPGFGLAFIGAGFGSLTAFIALLYADHGWGSASLAFTVFGAAFVVARLFFSPLPDRIGGAKVALVCVLIEALGQFLIWPASGPILVLVGAAFSGFGYSLAFPGFGVEAVRRAPPESRGLAMGAYVAFLDMSLGVTGPVLGLVASHFSTSAVYLAAGLLTLCAFPIAARLLVKR